MGLASRVPRLDPEEVRDPADSSITEQGYFLSLGSSSPSPKWAGKDDVLYSIDYQRGIVPPTRPASAAAPRS